MPVTSWAITEIGKQKKSRKAFIIAAVKYKNCFVLGFKYPMSFISDWLRFCPLLLVLETKSVNILIKYYELDPADLRKSINGNN